MIPGHIFLKSGFSSLLGDSAGHMIIFIFLVIIVGPIFWIIGLNARKKRERDTDSNSAQSSVQKDGQDTKDDE